MNCQKCKNEIEEQDLRREHLSGAAEAHLAACASCRAFGEERLALRQLISGLEKVSAPADFDFRVRARMAAELAARRAPRTRLFNFAPAALSWPLAACLALVVSAALYFQQQQPDATLSEHASNASPLSRVAEATAINEQANAQTSDQVGEVAGDQAREEAKVVVNTGQDDAATHSKNQTAQRRRVLPERAVAAAVREATLETAGTRVEDSSSAGLMGSTVRFDATNARRGEGALIPVQLGASERPLNVVLRDRSGEARTISVDSVSFGSRDVIGRPASFAKASLSSNQGVW
ncbi:MAG TPA: hypothetical protein VJ842_08755 [Pyrinomonadaceae bacterium]|nr:hypothetical protein [Pyrinomonadaceae bacterium]